MENASSPVVAIDGPGGAGKGTVAAAVARELGWHLLDSGALYRLVALAADRASVDLDDAQSLAFIARELDAQFELTTREVLVRLGGRDVTPQLRDEAIGEAASRVAAVAAVRTALVDRQRAFREPPGLVADGRDMGSTIFPEARLKIFLTASVAERARRRYKQLKDKGIDVSLPALSEAMADRDRRDTERSVAPLTACPDARTLDTTAMDVDEVVSTVLVWVAEAYGE